MTTLAASTGGSIYWYTTRGSGAVALVLLTASVVVGIAVIARLRTSGVPRFIVDGVHRTVSLLAVVFLVVHILTSVLDSFAPITLLDAVVPFTGTYRPLWLGLGAVAFDLLVAVTITSLIRVRLGYGVWKGVHWLAYASWPVAVVHSFGTGSDARQGWMLGISLVCIAAVLGALVVRALIGWPRNAPVRLAALGLTAIFAVGLIIWLPGGPLAKGWARRAGTPANLLPHSTSRRT